MRLNYQQIIPNNSNLAISRKTVHATRRSRSQITLRTQPESNSNTKKHFPPNEGLPLSLYARFDKLPPDGKLQTEQEETCDPLTQRCQTPTFVYESKCIACTGTGMIASGSSRRSRHTLYTCVHCHGLGYVRRTTTRFVPPYQENGDGGEGGNGVFTLGREVEWKPQKGHMNGNGNGRTKGKFYVDKDKLNSQAVPQQSSSQNGRPKE